MSEERRAKGSAQEQSIADPRIAVIAIHGVAEQVPNDTARAVAKMLCHVDKAYDFDEKPLRIEVKPLIQTKNGPGAKNPRLLDLRSEYVKDLHEDNAKPADASFRFMNDQIKHFQPKPEDTLYDTIVQRGERTVNPDSKADKPNCKVDIFEMYWADLSRLGSGFLQVFSELFQLLFHLSSLGRQTVDLARGHNPRSLLWKTYSWSMMVASLLLSVFLPITYLCILATLSLIIPANIPPDHVIQVAAALIGAPVTAGVVFLLGRRAFKDTNLQSIELVLSLVLLVEVVAAIWFAPESLKSAVKNGFDFKLLAVVWCLWVFGIVFAILWSYDKRRPGIKWVGFAACLLAAGYEILTVFQRDTVREAGRERLVQSAIDSATFVNKVSGFFWLIFFLAWFAVLGFAYLSPYLERRKKGQPIGAVQRVARVALTARISLAVSTAMYAIVSFALLSATFVASQGLLKKVAYPGTKGGAEQAIRDMLAHAGTPLLPSVLGLLALGLVFSGWVLLPAVWTEVKPPKPQEALGRSSKDLGEWLTSGSALLRLALVTIELAMVVFIVGCVIQWFYAHNILPHWFIVRLKLDKQDWFGATLAQMLGVALAGATGGLVALRGKLAKLSAGLRAGLDAVLDVDNYLREHPRTYNPRGRICARYGSLLRYILAHEPRYDAVLIVAHSQGTFISADLLRFICDARKEANEKDLAESITHEFKRFDGAFGSNRIPTLLFTFGSPLRQLLDLRFPDLYGWAQSPKPEEAGLIKWANAYRSGDVIGRQLWRENKDPEVYTADKPEAGEWGVSLNQEVMPVTPFTDKDLPGAYEFCVGAGGHTHYLDETAPIIARQIDVMITETCNEVARRRNQDGR